ncbi:MAG TPA: Gfo/Idh/MocA family oxidoreductase [bacterium]|nr:Gfo/Idh/MocA family oxidoreductase [bacterium]
MKVVIIGVHGHMGIVFRDIEKYPGARIVGFAPGCREEDASGRFEMWKPRYPDVRIYDDYRKMVDELKPDVAAVGSYYYKNSEITKDLLRRGIHCLSEKPAALNLEELEELKEVYSKSGVEYATMLEMRYSPLFLAAYNEMKKGTIGTPLMTTAQKTYKLGERSFLFRNRSCYGGTISFVGIHGIDMILWVMDSLVDTIFARHTREGNAGHGELESCGIVGLSFKNGRFGAANIDFLNPAKADGHGDDRLRIAGDKGIIEVKEGKTVLVTNDEPPVSLEEKPSRFFFPDFLAQIEKKGECLLSAEDSFYSTEIVLKARQAADEKKVINL